MTQILIALIIGEQRGPELAFRHCYLFILFFLSRTTSALASTGDTVPLTYLIPTQIQSCSSLQLRKAMEILNWMHRKLQPSSNYSQVSQKKDALWEDAEETRETMVESDTDALLLHDMHNGILAIGTFSHHHPLVSRSHSDPEEFRREDRKEAQGAEGAKLFAVAREPSFKIKLPVEDEKTRTMEVVQVHEVLQVSEKKILELPLLKEDQVKRERRRRTTLADLLAGNALEENGANLGGQAAGNPCRQEHAAQEQ
ncbi:protein TILLER ANGLE CONTROL 1-like [Musa acuminata AAA Group]|uniref:protein TILLER ANGLE CONTROL 1-like n=1 Tax=Musa acuminata AAA Group TaxID=214697 RepID=UPI0031D1FFEB